MKLKSRPFQPAWSAGYLDEACLLSVDGSDQPDRADVDGDEIVALTLLILGFGSLVSAVILFGILP